MTNEELKTAITKALEDITIKWKEGRNEAISFILAELQPLVDADQQRIKRLEGIVAGPAMTKDKYSYRPTNHKEGQGDFVVLDSTDLMRPVFFGDEGHARIHCKFLNTKAVFEPGLNYKIEQLEKALRRIRDESFDRVGSRAVAAQTLGED